MHQHLDRKEVKKMNNENIKVSFKQVEEIISKLNATSSLINSKITNYKTNLKSIIDKGYLDGVAELSINVSCDKVAKLCTEFKEYSETHSKI
jgi:cupin superfamily acireductone dioxygenase involved in methionine salvage